MNIYLENEELELILDVLDRRDNYLACVKKNMVSPSQKQQVINEMENVEKLLDKIQKTIKWN